MMTNQPNLLISHELTRELNDIYKTAIDHFKEQILPALKRKQKLTAISQEISIPSPCLPKAPIDVKVEDHLLIDNLRKENFDLKSKVRQTISRRVMLALL